MIARNLMTNKEYEVIDGSTIWADIYDPMVLDMGEHWYVLDIRNQQYVKSGFEYMTYEVDGLNYFGYYTPKSNTYISLETVMKYINLNFDYIPKKYIELKNHGTHKSIVIEHNNQKISIRVSFILSHNETTKEREVRNFKMVYDYHNFKKGSWIGTSLDSWNDLNKYLTRHLDDMGIIPTDTQLSIFDL